MRRHHVVRLTTAQIDMLIWAATSHEKQLGDDEDRTRDRLVLGNAVRQLSAARAASARPSSTIGARCRCDSRPSHDDAIAPEPTPGCPIHDG